MPRKSSPYNPHSGVSSRKAGLLSTLLDCPSGGKYANSLPGIQGLMDSEPKMAPGELSLPIFFILVHSNYTQSPRNAQLYNTVWDFYSGPTSQDSSFPCRFHPPVPGMNC